MNEKKPEPIEVTITHLEMSAPPAHYPPLPLGQNVALWTARAMPRHFYRYLMDRVGRKWHWVNMLGFDDDALDARLAEPDRKITTLYLDGAPAGFFEIAPKGGGHNEIVFFGMMAHAMGRGLGRWFLGSAIAAAWAGKPASISVETCTLDHPAALPLYQKLGFSPVSQSTGIVQPLTHEERSAIIMRP